MSKNRVPSSLGAMGDKDLLAMARDGNVLAAGLLLQRMRISAGRIGAIIKAWHDAGPMPVHAAKLIAANIEAGNEVHPA